MRNFNTFEDIKAYILQFTLTSKKADTLVSILCDQPEFIVNLSEDRELRNIFSGSNFEKAGCISQTCVIAFFVAAGARPYADNPRRLNFHLSPSRSKDLIPLLLAKLEKENIDESIETLCRGILILVNFEGCDNYFLIEEAIGIIERKINSDSKGDGFNDLLSTLKRKITYRLDDKILYRCDDDTLAALERLMAMEITMKFKL